MEINNARRRKAISPVLATVILIAITLIAAIAIAGFVFGLFGSFTSTARVSETGTALVHGTLAAGPTGSITVMNTGTLNTNANSMTLTWGGATCSPAMAVTTVNAGGALVTLTIAGVGSCGVAPMTASNAGEAFTGSIALSNGGQIPFSGVFS